MRAPYAGFNDALFREAKSDRDAARARAGAEPDTRPDRRDDAQDQAVRLTHPGAWPDRVPGDTGPAERFTALVPSRPSPLCSPWEARSGSSRAEMWVVISALSRNAVSPETMILNSVSPRPATPISGLLVECANHILRPHGRDSALLQWGLHLASRGGRQARNKAVVTVARKLAVLLHHLWTTQELYMPFYEQQLRKPLCFYPFTRCDDPAFR